LWVEFCLGSNGNLQTIKCRIYSEVERKDKIFATKLDSFCKHVGQSKVERNIGTNVKNGDWYHFKDNKHAKNYKLLGFRSHGNVVTQLANGMAEDNQRKVQFATILHCCNKVVPCKNMKQSSHCMNS
jgi:hypothetical protein